MKKTALVLTSVMLAGAAFSLAGCGGSASIGKVDGNFKEEATAEQLSSEAITNIDMSESFDTAKGFGFDVQAKLNYGMNMKMTMSNGEETITLTEAKMNGSLNAEYKFTAAKAEGEEMPVLLGAGKFNVNMKGDTKIPGEDGKLVSQKSEMKVDLKAYNDTQYVYVEGTMPDENNEIQEMAIKTPLSDFMDEIGKIIAGNGSGSVAPGYAALETEVSGGMTVQYDLTTMLTALQEEGFKVYLDTSKGVKVKVSAPDTMIKEAIGDSGVDIPAGALDFSAANLDIYLVFDEDGKFTQFGVDVNVKGDVKANESGMAVTASIEVKGGISVKTYSGKVTIPAGIADDEKYKLENL